MPERVAALVEALADTERAVDSLADKINVHDKTLLRVKIAGVLAAAGIAIALGLGVAVVENQAKINHLQTALSQETERNKNAQCAVDALFLQFEPRTLANPSYTDEQKQLQKQLYATLRQISADLGCPKQ